MKHVIIGNGPAAVSAAETLRNQDKKCRIVMLSKEAEPFYSPCPLAEYVEGSVPKEHLFLRDWEFYRKNDIELLTSHPVLSVDPVKRNIMAGGRGENAAIAFDKLLIASGAKAFTPPVPGLSGTRGVFTLKTLADADAILERIDKAERAVVIGSGFIGLEAVQALVRRGLRVTLLEAQSHVLPAMLDAEMAAIVEDRLKLHGVDVRTSCSARSVLAGETGVWGVLAGDDEIACEIVICAAGVRADLSYLDGSGIETNRGILVDERMRTNIPGVFAAGDVIERAAAPEKYRVLPNWPNAVSTGRIAAFNMLGIERRHPGLEAVNIVRIFDVPVTSFGVQSAEHVLRWQKNGAVRKLLLQDGKVAGGQMVGEINGTGVLHEMMKKGVAVERFGEALVRPGFGYIHAIEPLKAASRWA